MHLLETLLEALSGQGGAWSARSTPPREGGLFEEEGVTLQVFLADGIGASARHIDPELGSGTAQQQAEGRQDPQQ